MESEETFVPDYEDDLDEEETPVKTKREKHKSICVICRKNVKVVRKHTLCVHMPVQFNSDNHTCRNCAEVIIESLLRLAVLFQVQSVEALYWLFLDQSWSKPSFEHCKITEKDIQLLDNISSLLQIHPVTYQLHPPNSPAVLAHWRILSVLLSKLSPVDQLEFQYTSVFNLSSSCENVLTDSHFHLDQTLSRSESSCFSELLNPSNLPVAIAINNCCFSHLPSLTEIESIHWEGNRIMFSIGAHPRFVHSPKPSLLKHISSLVHSPLVIGIGEIGLDYTSSSSKHREQQASFILSLLTIAVKHCKVIVIHCRDLDGQTHAFHRLLSLFQDHVPKFHPIHFHCFTYSTALMYLWLNSFSNTCFGITSVLFKSKVHQAHRHLLSHISLHQILLESDSPYLATSSSAIQNIAQKFAKLRHIPLPQFNTMIYQNTKRLYKLD